MLPWLKRAVLGLGLAFIGLVLVLYLALRPPRFAIPEPTNFDLSGVTIVNPGQPALVGQRVRIAEGKIVEISPAPGGPERGKFLLPGLIDHHVHVSLLPDHSGLLLLRHGITAVRDPAAAGPSVAEYRKAWREGEIAGPRLFACGLPLEGDPPTFGGALVVKTSTEARQAAKSQIAEGVECIKVYNTLSLEALRAVTLVAQRHGVPVVGHVPVEAEVETSGLSGVEHLTGFPGRMSAASAREVGLGGWLRLFADQDDARVRAYARASREAGVAHTPTLVLWHEMHAAGLERADEPRAPQRMVPRFVREVLWDAGSLPPYYRLDVAGREALGLMKARTATVVLALHRAGVPVLAGSDAPSQVVPGAGLWQELRLLEDAGLSPEEVWIAATWAPGQRLLAGRLGRIEVGAHADVALFARNPMEDLRNLETLESVVVAGRRYGRAELDQMITESLKHYDGWFVSRVWSAIARRIVETMNARSGPATSPAGTAAARR